MLKNTMPPRVCDNTHYGGLENINDRLNDEFYDGSDNEYDDDEYDDEYSDDDTDSFASISIEDNQQKFHIVLCELFHPLIHGTDENSDPTISGQYIVYNKYGYIPPAELSDCELTRNSRSNFNKDLHAYRKHICDDIVPNRQFHQHPIIRNYKNIISGRNYVRPEIAKIEYLEGHECVAVLKTHWIRIIQRTWKRVYAARQNCIQMRGRPVTLFTRETNGIWPQDCSSLPELTGMLSGMLSSYK